MPTKEQFEELDVLEEDYNDSVNVFIKAEKDYENAYNWRKQMFENLQLRGKELQAFKERMQHDQE